LAFGGARSEWASTKRPGQISIKRRATIMYKNDMNDEINCGFREWCRPYLWGNTRCPRRNLALHSLCIPVIVEVCSVDTPEGLLTKVRVFSDVFGHRKTKVADFTSLFLDNYRLKHYIIQAYIIKDMRVSLEGSKTQF
jgi:hypothetical protein